MRKFKIFNFKELIKFWANYVKTHKDKEWSEQQKKSIDSQIKSAREFLSKNPKEQKSC
jgi:molecular chaperone DnaK (HSP70)